MILKKIPDYLLLRLKKRKGKKSLSFFLKATSSPLKEGHSVNVPTAVWDTSGAEQSGPRQGRMAGLSPDTVKVDDGQTMQRP